MVEEQSNTYKEDEEVKHEVGTRRAVQTSHKV